MIAPRLLILHGWGSSSKSWRNVQTHLEAQGIRVFVPDLPGFGSSPPPERAWNLEDYMEWVRTYADAQGLNRFFLLGHSFGGRVAVEFANRYRDRLLGVIFVASAGVTPPRKVKRTVFRIIAKIGNMFFFIPPFIFFRGIARWLLYAFTKERDYYNAQPVMRSIMKNVLEYDLTPRLKYISTPTLIVWGSDDTMTPVEDAYVFHRNIPHSKLVIFEGGTHGLNLQLPDKLAETVVEWIGSFG